MALLMLNQQLDGAREAVELALALAKRNDGTSVPVTVTGHSLGGALAQMTAAEYGLRGEDVQRLRRGRICIALRRAGSSGEPRGVHRHGLGSRSAFRERTGVRHGTGRGAAAAGYRRRIGSPGSSPAGRGRTGSGQDHAIEQFHGGGRDAKQIALQRRGSIIDPHNVTRYEHDRPRFDAYRNDIREAALTLRQGLAIERAGRTRNWPSFTSISASTIVSSKVGGVFDRDDELQKLQATERHPEPAAARRSVPQTSGPPHEATRRRWRVALRSNDRDLHVASESPAADAGIHDLFERLGIAALMQDCDAARAVARTYVHSEAGQTWLEQGVEYDQQLGASAIGAGGTNRRRRSTRNLRSTAPRSCGTEQGERHADASRPRLLALRLSAVADSSRREANGPCSWWRRARMYWTRRRMGWGGRPSNSRARW